MGVDLTIVPQRYCGIGNWFLGYDRISIDRNYKLFDRIKEISTIRFPENVKFDWYDDEGLIETKEDCYGDQLKYVHAETLANVFKESELSDRDKATQAYLELLPPDYWIVLWWH